MSQHNCFEAHHEKECKKLNFDIDLKQLLLRRIFGFIFCLFKKQKNIFRVTRDKDRRFKCWSTSQFLETDILRRKRQSQ